MVGVVNSTVLTVSSNTCFTFNGVNDEHSTYFAAPISCCKFKPSVRVIGFWFFSANCSTISQSSLKSNFVPTSIIGTLGQWWDSSGNHCYE